MKAKVFIRKEKYFGTVLNQSGIHRDAHQQYSQPNKLPEEMQNIKCRIFNPILKLNPDFAGFHDLLRVKLQA